MSQTFQVLGGGGGNGPGDRRPLDRSGRNEDTESFESKYDLPKELERIGDVTAEIGDITFKKEFSDPDVNIKHERQTADHEIVTGHTTYIDQGIEFVVQALGRSPPEIKINGWITESQLEKADKLVSEDVVRMVTSRYTGTAVPEMVDIPYSRVFHEKYGWIFEVTIELLGVRQVVPEMEEW